MNRVYRLVWNRCLAMFVPKTELARSHKKTKRATPALIGLFLTLCAAGSAHATTFLDFTGGLSSWTTGGSVTLSNTTVTVPTGGATFTLTPAAGYDMARINAPNSGNLLSPNSTLGLSANSLESFLNNSNGSITNFGLLTKSFSFNPGTYTFAWAYGAEDYQPYNDGAVFTLAGNGNESLVSLARNGSNPSDNTGPSPDTLILGSYGATPWLTMSFDIATAGTYQVGFAVYNWNDQSLAPNLYVSGIAGTYTGTPVQVSGGTLPPAAPPIIGGTGGNVSSSVFDPSSAAYSGTTLEFAGGTLQYTSDMTTSKDASLTGAGGAIDTNGFNVGYSGVLSGGSDFFKQGAGTLALSGTNTYTGLTNIDAGTLKLIGTGAIDASSGVVNNGTLDISGTTAGASVKTISGSGIVTLGSQNLTITGASGDYDGGFSGDGAVNIAGGTLTLGGSSTNTGGMNVTNGAKLIALNDAALGNGTLTLNNGALANSTSLSITKEIVIGGTSAFETAADTSITTTGSLSGSGNLIKSGAGSLVLAGDNSSFGQATPANIVVDDGTLVVASAKALGNANVQLNAGSLSTQTSTTFAGTLTIAPKTSISTAQNTVLTINSPVTTVGSGDGCFEKNGAGTLIMSGRADIAPGTCVQDGKLYANGQLNSNVTVKSDGILRGTGLIQGNATIAGRLAPGNSPGTLQIAGTVTMTAGSTYQEDINGLGIGHGPGNYSRLLVIGAGNRFVATGSTLEPNLTNITGADTYIPYVPKVGDTFRIVTAEGGIVGKFDAVTQPDGLEANTRIETYYDVGNSNSIDLVVVPTSYREYVHGNSGNENAQSAAGALDSLVQARQAGVTTTAQETLLYTLSTRADLASATTALSGEVHGALAAAAPLANRWLADSVGRQLSYGFQPSDGTGLWVDTGANRSDWNGDSVASGFDTTRSQIAIGWEPLSTESTRLGVGFTHGKVDVQDALGSGSITQDFGFLYGQIRAGRLVFDALGSVGNSDWETSRQDLLAPATTLSTDSNGHDHAITVGARLPFDTRHLTLSPYARFTAERLSRGAFDEGTASIVALSSAEHVTHGTRTMAGLVGGSREQRPTATSFTYQFDLGVGRDSDGLAQPTFAATLAGMSTVVSTPDVGRTFGLARIGGTARLTSWMYGYLGVSAEARSGKSEDLGANVGVRATF